MEGGFRIFCGDWLIFSYVVLDYVIVGCKLEERKIERVFYKENFSYYFIME